jgi:hypothetical protein
VKILQGTSTSIKDKQKSKGIELDFISNFMAENQKDMYLYSDVFQGLQKFSVSVIDVKNEDEKRPMNEFVSASDT